MRLYCSNSLLHCASDNGGTIPVTGFHSTIDNPDSVRRVAPPTRMVATTSATTIESHQPMIRRCGFAEFEFVMATDI